MKKKILVSTGGSGGHVIPATIIYEHLKNEFDVLLTIDKRGMKFINLQKYNFPEFQLDIRVSSGFYVRSLINDLGELLDCPSHMIALNRTSVGDFHLTNSIKLNELDGLIKNNQLDSHIISIDYVLKNFPRIF